MHPSATSVCILVGLLAIARSSSTASKSRTVHSSAERARYTGSEVDMAKNSPLRSIDTVHLDLEKGTCGGSTGFRCAMGLCCSTWGYCGQGTLYCSNSSALNETVAPPEMRMIEVPNALSRAPGFNGSTDRNRSLNTTQSPPNPSVPTLSPVDAVSVVPTLFHSNSSRTASPTGTVNAGLGNTYKMYMGNGSPSSGWPDEGQWISFENAWLANIDTIRISCGQFGQENPSDQEIIDTKSAIEEVSNESAMDVRFVFAIMMQESKGCVRVPTTAWSHENPGLFQSFQGTGTCNANGSGIVPCPASMIKQMVSDGVSGTTSGPGLRQNLEQSSATGSQKYYEAARIYNAGSIPDDGDLGAPGATQCYCSDVANRLTGWTTAESHCVFR